MTVPTGRWAFLDLRSRLSNALLRREQTRVSHPSLTKRRGSLTGVCGYQSLCCGGSKPPPYRKCGCASRWMVYHQTFRREQAPALQETRLCFAVDGISSDVSAGASPRPTGNAAVLRGGRHIIKRFGGSKPPPYRKRGCASRWTANGCGRSPPFTLHSSLFTLHSSQIISFAQKFRQILCTFFQNRYGNFDGYLIK